MHEERKLVQTLYNYASIHAWFFFLRESRKEKKLIYSETKMVFFSNLE